MNKIDVARRQLGVATQLFIDDLCPISVHTLADAASELAEGLCEAMGKRPFSHEIREANPGIKPGTIKWTKSRYANAFKHMMEKGKSTPRDDASLLRFFDDTDNDSLLFMAWYDFSQTGTPLPIEAQIFQIWFSIIYLPGDPFFSVPDVTDLFGDLVLNSRTSIKEKLRYQCEQARQEPNDDPKTDPRPLVLPNDR